MRPLPSIRSRWMFLVLSLCSAAHPERAHANLIVNGSFESPVLSPGAATTFTPGQTLPLVGGPWKVVGAPGTSIYLLQDTYSEPFNGVPRFNAQDGLNSVDLSGPSNVGPSAGVEQIVPVTGGQEYVLFFDVGRVTPSSGPGGVYPGAATVDVSIDGGARVSFTNSDVTLGVINWKQFSYTFTPAGNSTTIDFFNGTPSGTNEAGLDHVVLIPMSALGVGDAPAPMSLRFAAPSPNPATNATVLRYTLSRAGHVRLAVYDVSGRMVRLVRDDERGAGEHAEGLPLNGEVGGGLTSGLYFVRLEAEGRVLTRRLAILR